MTAATSNNTPEVKASEPITAVKEKPKSFFGVRYRSTIRANKKSLVVTCVLHAIGLPLIAVMYLLSNYVLDLFRSNGLTAEQYNDASSTIEAFIFIGGLALFLALLTGFITPQNNFSYLYKKNQVDMTYALPLSSRQRFFADYLAGVTSYMAPVICAVILFFAIMGIGSAFVDIKEFWEAAPGIIRVIIAVIVIMLQFYTLTVFTLTFCGSQFESSLSIMLMQGMIPAFIFLLWLAVVESGGFGMIADGIMMKPAFACTSPIGGMIFLANYVPEMTYLNDFTNYTSMYSKWLVITILVTALYCAAAYFLYSRRKAEDVSKPYVYRSFFYILMTMAVFCIMSLFVTFDGAISAGVTICAVGWFIMEVITRRGFKKFWTAPVGFALAVAGVLGICYTCKETDGFGAARSVPSAASVESVDITCDLGDSFFGTLRFKDKDVIKAAIEVQKNCIDDYFNGTDREPDETDDIFFCSNNVTLIYSTYTGSRIYRSYEVPSDDTGELMKAILLSDEYAEFRANEFVDTLEREWSYSLHKELYISDKTNFPKVYDDVGETSIRSIAKAYEADLKNMTKEELEAFDIQGYVGSLFVLKSFDNTLGVLESLDITIPDVRYSSNVDKDINLFVTYPSFCGTIDTNEKTHLYHLGTYHLNGITTTNMHHNLDSFAYNRRFNTDKEALEMAERSVPLLFNETPIAITQFGSEVLYLRDTPDNREFLESILD